MNPDDVNLVTKKAAFLLQHYKRKILTNDQQKRVISPYIKTKEKKTKYASFEIAPMTMQSKRRYSVAFKYLQEYFTGQAELQTLLLETGNIVKATVGASMPSVILKSSETVNKYQLFLNLDKKIHYNACVRMFLVDETKTEIYVVTNSDSRHRVNWRIEPGTTVAAYVAYYKDYVMVDDIVCDLRFPDGVGYSLKAEAVLCVPIVSPETNECIAVIELTKIAGLDPFTKTNLQIVVVVAGWMGAAIFQNKQRVDLQKQRELNDYLVSLIKCYFAYNVNLEKMISEVIQFAKATIGAERGSFYIIEQQKDDVYADFYDEGVEDDGTIHKKNLKFNIGKDKGIAGTVAFTGETINLKDAYADDRFNVEYDQRTGYLTKTMLCMPIKGMEGILGVLQLINKIDGGVFTENDEYILDTFASYSALALHFSRVMNELNTVRKLNFINRGLVKYHLKPCPHDVDFFYSHSVNVPVTISEFSYYISRDLVEYMPHLVSYMLLDLIDSHEMDIDNLMSFMLVVRKGYRPNAYHNYEHAFTVMNCMYNFLLRNLDIFTKLEIKALLIATICHDLDHRGFTNNFMILTNDMLAQLYNESTMENHHVYMSMLILENYNIFPKMEEDAYVEFSKEIRTAIIATDLALYFKVRMKLSQICNDVFEWNNPVHRVYGKELMMTACDLSAMCKPFAPAKMITDLLYVEFYHQGDIEKSMDLMPLSMMDREKSAFTAEDQVQFLTVVVLPCNELIKKILPNTRDLYDGCFKLREAWKEIIEMRGQKVWKQNESVTRK